MAEENRIITLRAHHLLNLYDKCSESEGMADVDKYFGEGMGRLFYKFLDDLSAKKYGFEFTLFKNAFYEALIKSPEKTVKITDSFDYVCFRCPPNKKEECKKRDNSFDSKIAEEFGLEIGKSYKVGDVLEKAKTKGKEFFSKYSALLAERGLKFLADCIGSQ